MPPRWKLISSVARDDAELEILGVDGELVAAEADDILAIDVELLAVLELADGVLAEGLEPRSDVVGLGGVADLLEVGDDVADLVDHEVGGEVAVDVLDGLEAVRGGGRRR